jgi:hypothetical protein
MGDNIREMALRCYGYGRWEAPYWFIGPEQGQGPEENNDLNLRCEAWLHCGGGELSDCRKFCDFINEKVGQIILAARIAGQRAGRVGDDLSAYTLGAAATATGISKAGLSRAIKRGALLPWHQTRPPLQSTWRPLMSLLMTFLERPADNESLRAYQRDHWGMRKGERGETCVIELSGLPANSFKVPRNRETFRRHRIKLISEKMRTHKPALVVMYGLTQRTYWEKIAGGTFPNGVLRRLQQSTLLALAEAPTAHGVPNAYWVDLGKRLREY